MLHLIVLSIIFIVACVPIGFSLYALTRALDNKDDDSLIVWSTIGLIFLVLCCISAENLLRYTKEYSRPHTEQVAPINGSITSSS